MKQTIHNLNDAYDYIQNLCYDPYHPKINAMLDAIDEAITIIENAQRINDKFTQLLTEKIDA